MTSREQKSAPSQLGKPKAEVMAARLRDINPDIDLTVINDFVKDERMEQLLDNEYDYVVDAIDTISPKVFLILHCLNRNLNWKLSRSWNYRRPRRWSHGASHPCLHNR